MNEAESIIIAIDGPAAAGKGTLARKLANHMNYAYLDTGSLYRAIAYLIVQAGNDPANAEHALKTAKQLDLTHINQTAIRTAEIGLAASKVAAQQAVRDEILDLQRRFAALPPDGKTGAVLDGRDIGTVVCPDAKYKFFVTANAKIRAHRRWLELHAKDNTIKQADVLADLTARDKADSERKIAPLKPAEDALLLDTTNLAIEDTFKAALALVTM